jgi:hypothetical protein
MKKILLCLMMLANIALLSPNLQAQGVTTSSMTGTITDATGNPLPGATVIAVHTPSGTQYASASLGDGRFNIPGMRIGGPYKVTVTSVGSKEQVKDNIFLSLGNAATVNLALSDATTELGEVVISAGRGDVFSSDRTGASTNISNQQISSLPTLNRSFDDFTRLTPQAGGPFGSIGGRNGGYNNITIDGAIFNNAFGLSSTIGGQANAQPVSLDAVDQIQVSLAPYDVREGSFTGAAINAVTRSGDNEFRGSVFYYTRNQNMVGKKVENFEQDFPDFDLNNVGFRLGGPIVKNKLFFFINAELERRNDPPTPTFFANRPGRPAPGPGSSTSVADAASLDALRAFLIEKYGYDPGAYEGFQLKSNSEKATAKIDWNISNKHRFNIKYNFLRSFRDVPPSNSGALTNGRNPSNTNLPFQAAYYRINNNLNSVIAELNSTFSTKLSNNFTVGFTAMRDFRESTGGIFPGVDIGNGAGSSFTSFGYEPFSANNKLNTNIFQISDNLTIFAKKHTITIGTYNEFYKFQNGFAPNFYGGYQFSSLANFYAAANSETAFTAQQYLLRYTATPGAPFPLVEVKAMQLGLYAQDEFAMTKNFKLTLGVRADLPIINTDIEENTQTTGFTFRDGEKINTSEVQKNRVLWSPRIGFNWDVFNNQSTQIRGGSGIFTGRVPFVWISNQASNNGLLFGSVQLNAAAVAANQIYFSPNVDEFRGQFSGASANYNLAVTERDFKFPQIWRSNIAIDQKLPGDIIATAEFAYTKDLNSVYHENANLPIAQTTSLGADNRPRFTSSRINSNISDAIVMKNTDEGYSYFATFQLQKTFSNGFYASLAYNYSDSRSINDGGSIAQSIWRDRVISGDPNEVALSFSNFLVKHRIVGSASYNIEYLKNLGTTVSLFYTGAPSDRFSYTYAGDMNGDGSGGGGNDLIYIPRKFNSYADATTANEINLVDIVYPAGGGTYTAAEQWADLEAYIEQDEYLNGRRGSYAERNGAQAPFQHRFDFKLIQDFYINNGNGKRNTLQLSLDIFNIGNLLNKDWGTRQTTNRAALLDFRGYNADGEPTFRYAGLTGLLAGVTTANDVPLRETFRNDTGIASRWQLQFGIRYIFN